MRRGRGEVLPAKGRPVPEALTWRRADVGQLDTPSPQNIDDLLIYVCIHIYMCIHMCVNMPKAVGCPVGDGRRNPTRAPNHSGQSRSCLSCFRRSFQQRLLRPQDEVEAAGATSAAAGAAAAAAQAAPTALLRQLLKQPQRLPKQCKQLPKQELPKLRQHSPRLLQHLLKQLQQVLKLLQQPLQLLNC